eukprot:CAMPEP_0203935244 /NCGR_PEP_ID=MMETSP0359-20131031/73041_1 /ASSEMBLY_ACC=CAM_ASM_000338 /TAXON_ID=268821 /ORGANISM="Scrippsiella Hangoei, Strain SHTV-5" /LENGTH=266 /DNA_ID=CAMNT_0050865073 /DNA_START=11 /DNA_END=811 /DNA_ORIENTATION=-
MFSKAPLLVKFHWLKHQKGALPILRPSSSAMGTTPRPIRPRKGGKVLVEAVAAAPEGVRAKEEASRRDDNEVPFAELLAQISRARAEAPPPQLVRPPVSNPEKPPERVEHARIFRPASAQARLFDSEFQGLKPGLEFNQWDQARMTEPERAWPTRGANSKLIDRRRGREPWRATSQKTPRSERPSSAPAQGRGPASAAANLPPQFARVLATSSGAPRPGTAPAAGRCAPRVRIAFVGAPAAAPKKVDLGAVHFNFTNDTLQSALGL